MVRKISLCIGLLVVLSVLGFQVHQLIESSEVDLVQKEESQREIVSKSKGSPEKDLPSIQTHWQPEEGREVLTEDLRRSLGQSWWDSYTENAEGEFDESEWWHYFNSKAEEVLSISEDANETFFYDNREAGFSIELPYNSEWGGSSYVLSPFEQSNQGIEFGGMRLNDVGYGIQREFFLGFHELQNKEDLIKEMTKRHGLQKIDEGEISGKKYMHFLELVGDYAGNVYVVLGPKFSIAISSSTSNEKPIHAIISSIEFRE